MRTPALVSGVFALAVPLWPVSGFAQPGSAGMIVPAYQYPTLGTLWADCAAAAARVPLVAILNPANGPGANPDPAYVQATGAVRSAGGRVVGYLPTSEAGIPLDTALEWVDRYRAWYALDGLFLDEMTHDADAEHIAWYRALRGAIREREPGWLVVGSPGTNTRTEYLEAADILCIHESDSESYFQWEPEPWVEQYPASRFLHLVHSLSSVDGMREAVERARSSHAAWVYVTHDRMVNPWDETPTYWNQLVAAVETTQVVSAGPVVAPAASLRAWPNPARGAIRFEWRGDPSAPELEVLDGAGRLVARLPAGRALEWDGCDRSGTPAPPGVYFARVRGAHHEAVRVTLVR